MVERLDDVLLEERKFDDDELFEELDDEFDTVPLLDDDELLKLLPLLFPLLVPVLCTVPRLGEVVTRELLLPDDIPTTRLLFKPEDVAPPFLIVELTLPPLRFLP